MPRTTLDLDASVLNEELNERRRREGKSLGRTASELLVQAMATGGDGPTDAPLTWATGTMRARVDLEDAEAVRRALDDRPA